MHYEKIFRASLIQSIAALLLAGMLLLTPALGFTSPESSRDSQIFVYGFNAYQAKEYDAAIGSMSLVLEKYPETPLRDMAMFWLARSYYRAGKRDQAARQMAQFLREYPNSPLKGTVEGELLSLAQNYGNPVPAAASAPEVRTAPAAAAPTGEAAQVFNLEVAQYADLAVHVGPMPETVEAGALFHIPLEIVNTGNGGDRFALESGFPREFDFHFAAASAPDVPIAVTPMLAAGERFAAVAVGVIPRATPDGQRIVFPIRIASSFAREASQSREIALVAAAPVLRAVVREEKAKLLPGERIGYAISLLNVGTAAARGVTTTVSYPPQYEPVALQSFRQENRGVLVLDGLHLKSGESRNLELAFRLKDEAQAGQELSVRTDVVDDLQRRALFVSAVSVVQRVAGVTARTAAEKLVVVPGQTVSVPIVVTNTGNVRELFGIRATLPAGVTYSIAADVNRDGKRQPGEPLINYIGPLPPKEDAGIVLEMNTPPSARDGESAQVSVVFEPETAGEKPARVDLRLSYTRPVVELTMAAKGERLRPGEVSSLALTLVNRGSSTAKQVAVHSSLPGQLEVVAAEPEFTRDENGVYSWRLGDVGAGERRGIKVTYKVRAGVAVGTSVQLKHVVNYRDAVGNRY